MPPKTVTIAPVPRITATQAIVVGRNPNPREWMIVMSSPITIIKSEMSKVAMTGATQDTGIRKSTSHEKSDSGHPVVALSRM